MKKHLFVQSGLARKLDLESLALLSAHAETCPLQDPFRIRARYLGWKTASLLLDEQGELKSEILDELIRDLSDAPYPVGFGQEGDAWLFAHLRVSLQALAQEESLKRALKKCSMPLCNHAAEEMIRGSLWPEEVERLQTVHVRRAVLSAWLTLLRQTTGSCFATTPAVIIQRQNPLRLLQDLDEILSAGQLRRGGYSVPMNPGSGLGDLVKPIDIESATLSPGLRAGFQAVGLSMAKRGEIDPQMTAQKVFSDALLKHFELTSEDLAIERASPLPQFGVLWERVGGHFEGLTSPKMKLIRAWEQAKTKAEQAFLSLADCTLLRCWEYTLASFSDIKVEFARWNLYYSLGLDPQQQPGGIGAYLLEKIQQQLDEINDRIAQLDGERRQAIGTVYATESLLKQSTNEAQHYQLKGELVAAVHTAESLADLITEVSNTAQWLTHYFNEWIQNVIDKLQHFFQEVFDPSLVSTQEQFEDSPAGFRLLYKYGRTSTASWERIENERQYVDAIYHFFESLEREILIDEQQREHVTALMTELLQYIRSSDFLDGALARTKDNRITKKGMPWAYESGGTMQGLLQNYFEQSVDRFSRSIQSPVELLAFLKEGAQHVRHLEEPIPIQSPTHAFLFYPSWLERGQQVSSPAAFFKQIVPTPDEADFLADRLSLHLKESVRPLFFYGYRQQPFSDSFSSLRKNLLESWTTTKQGREEWIDSFLYESLPLVPSQEVKQVISRLWDALRIRFDLPTQPTIAEPQALFLTSREVIQACFSLLPRGFFSSVDWQFEIAEEARRAGFAYPQPILFADTNWSDWCFGFVQNFATDSLELWRLSRSGLRGIPMTEWTHFFQQGGTWSIMNLSQ